MTYLNGGESVPLVFLCYRGIDRSYAPMLIDRELTRRFGREHVFEAGRSNTPGTDIPDAILDSVARCSLLIPLIDPAWVEDRELLFREKDWVRREIAHALRHRRRILPVLLDGAEVPRAGDLPDDITDLPRKIVLRMRSRTADADLARLVGEVERLAPELVLAGLTDPVPPAPARPADLLRAEHAVFPFRHRPELDELDEWCRDPQAHPVRLVTGPSGAGKTRVGLRLAQQRHGDGWAAGRLSPTAGPDSLDWLHESVHDTLVVVDDAETRPAVVRAALQSLVGAPAATVRVLLLARAAGAWLDDLRADADDAVAATAEKIAVRTLEPLRPTAADLDLALTTLAERGADFGFGAPAPSDRQPPATLMEVQVEALVRLLSEDGSVTSPMRRLAELEKEHWQRAARAQGLGDLRPRDLGEIMAAVSLFGADTDQEAEDLLRSLFAFQGRPRDVDAGLDLVRTLLPGPAALNALQPDQFAVEVVADCLRAGRAPAAAVATASGAQIARAVVLLGRCLADDPGLAERGRVFATADPARFLTVAMTALAAVPDPGPLVEVMTTALDDLPDGGLSSVVDALPQRSQALAHFAVAATEAALAAVTDEQERARAARSPSGSSISANASRRRSGWPGRRCPCCAPMTSVPRRTTHWLSPWVKTPKRRTPAILP
jgi:hypothetical protein